MGVDAIGIQLRSYKKMDVLLKIEIMNDDVSFANCRRNVKISFLIQIL